jgi:hypothetical protein
MGHQGAWEVVLLVALCQQSSGRMSVATGETLSEVTGLNTLLYTEVALLMLKQW